MSSNDPLAVNVQGAAAQRAHISTAARPAPGNPGSPGYGREMDEIEPVRPFGTGGMIDRIGSSVTRLEAMFKQLENAIEPTLERAGEQPNGPVTGNAQAVQVPNTEHGELLYEIESRLDSLTRRMNAVGARVRL